ncbi:hypothetical protein N7491_009922 [Penicillium cf. griseofulvum]|uniref:Uncharacterized protein n=1 Tax=Penicillium cf. griseofulvum TaxID=2972120 RepID=A0A9W9T692_9EURO|nr:hypothetical protein N7472_000249 [Penicillium cf. griseofulvum]KAJ5421477.1 hypothetical protein N7491_009922 [Penicillium cf. griseofulvum]KAJ5424709.1 hypothetical protein N7445_010682 [Penicillium cf. griseofulvum]
MRIATASAAPASKPCPVGSGIAGLEEGVGVEVCEPVPELVEETVVRVTLLVEVTPLSELSVGVASALLAADKTWAE